MLATWIGGKLNNSKIESTAAMFLGRIILVVLQVVLLLAVVQVLGVPMTSMFAVLGAAGLAIGLALKDSLSNIASGVMLVTLRPFHVNDLVTINGVTGKVEMVSIFQTRLARRRQPGHHAAQFTDHQRFDHQPDPGHHAPHRTGHRHRLFRRH